MTNAKILQAVQPREAEVVEYLRDLLAKAEAGQILAFGVVAWGPDKVRWMSFAGRGISDDEKGGGFLALAVRAVQNGEPTE